MAARTVPAPDPDQKKEGNGWLAVAQLLAISGVLYLFRIERAEFVTVFLVGAATVAVTTVAPERFRHGIHVVAALVAGSLTVGPIVTAVAAGIAVLLILLVRLESSWGKWAGLAVILGAMGYARWLFARQPMLLAPMTTGVRDYGLSIVGSIFAFRALIFVHAARRARPTEPFAQQLSYFLLLPNFAMPLFPPVDYRAYIKSHRGKPSVADYHEGVNMVIVAVLQLLAYRLIFRYFILDPAYVTTPLDRVRYVLGFYLLYVRVSGLFHLGVGLLWFLGYRMPKTHAWYFLAHSFADFWRRVNVYYRDFNEKFVYTPVAMALNRKLSRGAIQIAVFITLVAAWAFHAYQFFWLVGEPLLDAKDFAFWMILAFAMIVSATLEERRAKQPRAKGEGGEPSKLRHAFQVVTFFCTITVLWSFWSAGKLTDWLRIMGLG